MDQTARHEEGVRTTSPSKPHRFGHWLRVGVMFISGGFAFPHALTESDDTKRDAEQKANKTT